MALKKRKTLIIGCFCLAMLILGGFGIYKISQRADVIEKSAGFHTFGKEYTENKDGTYTCDGKIYQYKIAMTGRERGAVKDSTFVVLTNDKDVDFQTVAGSLSNNGWIEDLEFTILGWSWSD